MEAKYLKINPADNVAVAITALPAGEKLTVDGKEITLNEDVPAGHKFALKDFQFLLIDSQYYHLSEYH